MNAWDTALAWGYSLWRVITTWAPVLGAYQAGKNTERSKNDLSTEKHGRQFAEKRLADKQRADARRERIARQLHND